MDKTIWAQDLYSSTDCNHSTFILKTLLPSWSRFCTYSIQLPLIFEGSSRFRGCFDINETLPFLGDFTFFIDFFYLFLPTAVVFSVSVSVNFG